MKKIHKNTHRVIWWILIPVLTLIIYIALDGRFDIENAYGESEIPAQAKELP